MPPLHAKLAANIIREADGFYYYLPIAGDGFYAAHVLRDIADYLDVANHPWRREIEESFKNLENAAPQDIIPDE